MNVCQLLERSARRFPDHGAVYLGTEQRQTYAQLRERALRLGRALGLRFPNGARIAVVSENRAESIEILFGIWAAGQVAVPINYKLHARETVQILADAQASAVFVSPLLLDALLDALRSSADAPRTLVVAIGTPEHAEMFDAAPGTIAPRPPESLAWLFYTSGTTGRSKGAMLSHRNLLAMTLAHLAEIEAIDEHASQIHAAPLSHGSGLYVLPSVAQGARQVIPASMGFDPDEFLALCDEHPACGAFLAPTMVQRLRRAAEASGRRPRGLRSIVYGGGPMYVEEMKKSLAVFGPVFSQIYGQGEAPMTITGLRRADHEGADDATLGSVGWARSGVEVAVLGPDGEPLPAGEPGAIVCRGDVVMLGYWRQPAATAETLRDGWLRTGDIGTLDARGCLTLRDRSKDVIISGGANIYPREVEEALLAHPGVLEVAVVGEADAEWGESVVAFVVRSGGEEPSAASLDQHCLDRIARFKRPKRYVFVDALPKNSYGKVPKRDLRRLLVEPQAGDGATSTR